MTASAVAIGALVAACAPRPRPLELPPAAGPLLPATVRVGGLDGPPGAIRQVPLEEYVLASILSEIAPAQGDPGVLERVFEIQAIVARTYAAANLGRHAAEGFDLCAGTHCQLMDLRRPQTSSWRPIAERAVAQTAGRVLIYDGRAALTVFHADCGGWTSAAADVWGGSARPYLVAVRDDLPGGVRHQTWRFEPGAGELRAALNRDQRTAIGSTLRAVEVVDRDAGGRNLQVRVRGARQVVVRAEDFRTAVTRAFGPRSLRSACFTVGLRSSRIVFEGRGFGHGVGLCQIGAQARAAAGLAPTDILEFYFPGTHLMAGRLALSPAPGWHFGVVPLR
jgi:stage II sporulation protein D